MGIGNRKSEVGKIKVRPSHGIATGPALPALAIPDSRFPIAGSARSQP